VVLVRLFLVLLSSLLCVTSLPQARTMTYANIVVMDAAFASSPSDAGDVPSLPTEGDPEGETDEQDERTAEEDEQQHAAPLREVTWGILCPELELLSALDLRRTEYTAEPPSPPPRVARTRA
jgi:hypothetical protein